MDAVSRVADMLPAGDGARLRALAGDVYEVRLRAGRPVQLVHARGEALLETPLSPEDLRGMLAALMDYSVYAREEELRQGFFTLRDGSRAGVCGCVAARGGEVAGMTAIGSVCLRVARALPGCADDLLPLVMGTEGPRSTLLISPPGMGKTTCLRDLARQLSDGCGLRVAIADERHEIAVCRGGAPTVQVGLRTDVMDGCPKWIAVRQLVRAMSPQVVVTDEIGGARDAEALADAVRCGVAVVASAHAAGFDDLERRETLKDVLRAGVFRAVALLGDRPGQIKEIRRLAGWREEGALWRCG